MKGFVDLCINRPVTVVMFLLALLLGGIFSLSVLPLRQLPEFSFPRVTVETSYPGLGAEDIRSVITIPVEDALSSVRGLERMRSVSRDGASLTVLDFRWGTDSGAASVLVREAIDAVYPSLPEGAAKPAVVPGDPDEQAQLIVAVSSLHGPAFARNLAEYELRSLFRRVDGVGAVMLSGGDKEELAVKVDLERAVSRGLPPSTLADILASETANIPAGNARDGDKELVVVSQGKPGSQAELEKLIFPSGSGSFVIGDIGFLNRAVSKKESLFITGTPSCEYTALEIFRRPGYSPVKLSRDLRKAVAEASADFGRDTEIEIIYDDAASVIPGIQKLFVSVILGTAAVMVVLFFTLRNFRYSLLAGLSLPLSMAASFAALAALGRSLNNMSLSGIALGIGLVSDTSVIMLDLLHHGFAKKEKPSCEELGTLAASVAASSFGGTATTAVVFIPVLFLPGPLGNLFGDLSIALVVSILTGWVYAQFALPSLFRMFLPGGNLSQGTFGSKLRRQVPEQKKGGRQIAVKAVGGISFTGHYAPLLKSCIQNPARVLGITAALCVIGLGFLLSRPVSFVSADAASEIEVVLNFPPGTTMESIAKEASLLGDQLAAIPGIGLVFGRAGSEKEDTARRSDPDYRKETFIFRCALGKQKQSAQLKQSIQSQQSTQSHNFSLKPVSVLASVNLLLEKQQYEAFAHFPQDKTEKLLGLSSSFVIAVKGRNREEAENKAETAEELIRGGGYSVLRRPWGNRPEIRLVPDREALAHAGISTAETAMAFYASAEGLTAGELELEGKPLPLKISAFEMPEPEALPVVLRENRPVFAGSIARFISRETPAALARLDRSDTLYIEASSPVGREKDLAAFLAALCNGKEGFYRVDESAFARYKSSLILTVVLVLILLYLTMGAEFESLSLPVVLLLAIPFSLAGAGPALFISGAGLDSSSVLALIVLFGLSVNSGMVLYEFAAEKKSLGITADEAVYEAALTRFRPVLTTALTTAFALFPLVISPLGAEEHSMALTMLGGIITSTTLTLFALPPVLIRFLKKRNRKS